MKYRGHNARTDANEAEIVSALKERGALVIRIGTPVDLLVGYQGIWRLCEVKSSPKAKIQKSQKDFRKQCENSCVPFHFLYGLNDVEYWFPQNVGTGRKNSELLPENSSPRTAKQSAAAQQEVDSS